MCEFCKKFDFSTAKTEVDKHGARLLTGICNTKFSENEQFNYCPVCGRILIKDSFLEDKAKFAIWDAACGVLKDLENIAHDCNCEPDWVIGVFKERFDMVLRERGYEVD